MAASSTANKLIDTAHIIESKGKHQHSLIWFHGFGDSSDGYKDLFTSIQPQNTRIVLPNAPKRWVTIDNHRYNMRSWFDDDKKDSQVFESVKELIEEELKLVDDASHIIIGGFSQGACLSLVTGLTYTKQQLGGVICCSGQLMHEDRVLGLFSEYARTIPILVLHGKDDNRISWDNAKNGYEFLKKNGVKDNMQVVLEDGVGHNISQRGFNLILMFIIKQFKL